jgi:hypothetical protein
MLRRQENSENYLSSAVFVVLCFIFICAFAKNSNPPVTRFSHYKAISEKSVILVALNDGQQISLQKNVLSFLENPDFRLLSDSPKIIDDNRSIHIRLLSLQQTERLIKPVLHQRLSYWYHSSDTGDLPDLS